MQGGPEGEMTGLGHLLLLAVSTLQFGVGRAVWPVGRADTMNDTVSFRGMFEPTGRPCVLEVAGSTCYRVCLNGEFVSFGPARGPKGMFRVDRIDLTDRLRVGTNKLEIEVNGANVNSYEYVRQPSFLLAELSSDGKVLLSTGVGPGHLEAFDPHERIRKVTRFNFQRLFGEAYRVDPDRNEERLELEFRPPVSLLPRFVPQPEYAIDESFVRRGSVRRRYAGDAKVLPRTEVCRDDKRGIRGYRAEELEFDVFTEAQRYIRDDAGPIDSTLWRGDRLNAGFIGVDVICRKPGRLVVFWADFEEPDGGLRPVREIGSCSNAIFWEIAKSGTYRLEGFNPNAMRFVETFMAEGEADVRRVWLREYKGPDAFARKFDGASDAELADIYAAAAQTLSVNAVDVFMDCPNRERAAWIGDSFFTARASAFLSGNTVVERNFIENILRRIRLTTFRRECCRWSIPGIIQTACSSRTSRCGWCCRWRSTRGAAEIRNWWRRSVRRLRP